MIKSRGMRGAGHVACIGEMRNAYIILVWKHKLKMHLGRPRHGWEYMDFKKQCVRVWTGFNWLKMGSTDRLSWARQWNFGFHKSWGISWLAERLSASQKGCCSV
jgi:hypothetical protein